MMPSRDPNKWSYIDDWELAVGMALFGSFVNWCTKMRQVRLKGTLASLSFGVLEFFYDFIVGTFIGILTILILYKNEIDFIYCIILSGGAGHAAPRLLFIIRRYTIRSTEHILKETK